MVYLEYPLLVYENVDIPLKYGRIATNSDLAVVGIIQTRRAALKERATM